MARSHTADSCMLCLLCAAAIRPKAEHARGLPCPTHTAVPSRKTSARWACLKLVASTAASPGWGMPLSMAWLLALYCEKTSLLSASDTDSSPPTVLSSSPVAAWPVARFCRAACRDEAIEACSTGTGVPLVVHPKCACHCPGKTPTRGGGIPKLQPQVTLSATALLDRSSRHRLRCGIHRARSGHPSAHKKPSWPQHAHHAQHLEHLNMEKLRRKVFRSHSLKGKVQHG